MVSEKVKVPVPPLARVVPALVNTSDTWEDRRASCCTVTPRAPAAALEVADALSRSGSLLVTALAVKGDSVPGLDRLSRAERRAPSRVLRVPRTVDCWLSWLRRSCRAWMGCRSLASRAAASWEMLPETVP